MKEEVQHVKDHMSELTIKLTESVKENETLKNTVKVYNLKESVAQRLNKEKNLSPATLTRLAESLLTLGEETREGDKPSNWDLRIKEEIDYVNQLKIGTNPVKPTNLKMGSETNNTTETVKLSESENRAIAARLSRTVF